MCWLPLNVKAAPVAIVSILPLSFSTASDAAPVTVRLTYGSATQQPTWLLLAGAKLQKGIGTARHLPHLENPSESNRTRIR